MTNASKTTARDFAMRTGLSGRRERRSTTINSEEAVRAPAAVGELLDCEIAVDLGPHLSREVGGGGVLVVGEGSGLARGCGRFELVEEINLILNGGRGDLLHGRVFQ